MGKQLTVDVRAFWEGQSIIVVLYLVLNKAIALLYYHSRPVYLFIITADLELNYPKGYQGVIKVAIRSVQDSRYRLFKVQ